MWILGLISGLNCLFASFYLFIYSTCLLLWREVEYGISKYATLVFCLELKVGTWGTASSRRALWPSLVPWKQEINLSCEMYYPSSRRVEDILITGGREVKAQMLLIPQFTIPNPNPFVFSSLHKFIVYLSERYKIVLWSLLWVLCIYGSAGSSAGLQESTWWLNHPPELTKLNLFLFC